MQLLKIVITIPYHGLDAIRRSLECIAPGMTVSVVAVPGPQPDRGESGGHAGGWIDRLQVEIVVTHDLAQSVMDTALEALGLQGLAIGPVEVLVVHDAVRIRTGESGTFAIR